MGWTVEQNTGINDRVIRCVWFKGYIYAFTRNAGVWRRTGGAPPWVRVFNGGGIGWYWEEDGALYCTGGAVTGGNRIYRSTDGVTWTLDVDLNVAFGLQAAYGQWAAMGGYGAWFLVASFDSTVPNTRFYRRNLAGTWAVYAAPHAGLDGSEQKGIIQWGARVFWTTDLGAGGEVRYWDGAAWTADATIDGLCGYPSHMSVVSGRLYIGASYLYSPPGGYYQRTTGLAGWRFLSHEIPNANWNVTSLCEGADGEDYTVSRNGAGTGLRVYRRVGNSLSLVGSEPGAAIGGTYIGVCVDATGAMYFGTTSAGPQISFYAFVGVYNLTPVGGGLYPQAMDADGDGDMLYISLYDTATAQPILVSVALPLNGATSIGNAMFAPGAGTAINVKCNNIGDNVAISGHFGANEQVETSDDAGLTWIDIDPGTWGAALAQPLVVDPITLDEVMIALTPQSIIETLDGGTTWTVNNAAVGYSPGAMVKLVNGSEMIIGDDAANRIDYSPNRGVNTANVTGAFVGNVAALEIT